MSTNSSLSVQSPQTEIIPMWSSRNPIASLIPTIPGDLSPPTAHLSSEPITKATNSEHGNPPHDPALPPAHHLVSHSLRKRVILMYHTILMPPRILTEVSVGTA
ncbi:hypothetical protein O181_005103 [Austropuccinia psidii MF-1]|uniref:Uncharacterized protein n=1 Tax=Austropuccinia psidii MF-1 TaxID=1389203 RepID=A0A9Q3BHW3_9BASI|nr:hypothetical protein [Austropuccinia psidii MF-1]